jgi:AraC-like DNA-binding protein
LGIQIFQTVPEARFLVKIDLCNRALAGLLEALDDREADLVADNFCRLLAVACGASAGEHQEAIRLGRLEEAKRYINLHLAEPGLAPGKAAASLKMSVRQLHRLFEPSGTTFAQYVTRCRLEECRAAIMNPIRDRAVTDIAFAWGFNSFATFHRNFRQAFDVAPSELRQKRPLLSREADRRALPPQPPTSRNRTSRSVRGAGERR